MALALGIVHWHWHLGTGTGAGTRALAFDSWLALGILGSVIGHLMNLMIVIYGIGSGTSALAQTLELAHGHWRLAFDLL